MASVKGSAARKKTFFWFAKSLTARPMLDRNVPASIATFSLDTSSLAAVCASAGFPPASFETTTSLLPFMPPAAFIFSTASCPPLPLGSVECRDSEELLVSPRESAPRPCRAPCAPARPFWDARSRPHAQARRFRRRLPPCRSFAPWRHRSPAPQQPFSRATRRVPRRSQSGARGLQRIFPQTDFRLRQSPRPAGLAG